MKFFLKTKQINALPPCTWFNFLPADGIHKAGRDRRAGGQRRQKLFLIVLGQDEPLLLLLRRVRFRLPEIPEIAYSGFPDRVGDVVAERGHDGQVARRPLVQVKGSNPGDVGPELPVSSGAFDAQQNSQVDAGPIGIWKWTQSLNYIEL